jgi:AraC-like DNA-binding protein
MNKPQKRCEDICHNLIRSEPGVFKGLNIKRLAKIYCVSCSYLSRTFKNYKGVNLKEYINRLRLTKSALMLMENRHLKVWQISDYFGWDCTYSFIKSFRKFYGVTPGKFRDLVQ